MYSISANDWPASDVWNHGGIVSMKDPEWFWNMGDTDAYWYKGKGKTREMDSEAWIASRTSPDSPGYTFEWHFATEDWVFFDGQDSNDRLQ